MASLGAGTDIGKLINLARRKNQKYDRTFFRQRWVYNEAYCRLYTTCSYCRIAYVKHALHLALCKRTETRDVRTADRESGTGTGPLADAQPHNFWVRGLTADLR